MAYIEQTCKISGKVWKQYNSLQKCPCDDCKAQRSTVYVPKKFNYDLKLKDVYKIPSVSKTNKKIIKEKSLSSYKADLQEEINLIVRLIDKGHPCFCDLTKRMKLITAGHIWSVGSNETLRFHLLNIWGQDFNSNGYKGGEPVQFKIGITTVYGLELWEQIEALKSIKLIDLSVPEIKEKIAIARGIVKWLKLQDRKFTTSERLELRIKFNNQLSIY